MMQRLVFALIVLLLLGWSLPGKVQALGRAKVEIQAVDEAGLPIDGAEVRIQFQSGQLPKDFTHGKTDKDGIFSASGFSADGVVGGGVDKNGYYTSVFNYDFYVKKLGFYQPWGKKLKVVMRPIVNPVPMYVRSNFFEIPVHGEEVGFDLEKGDWVKPHGQGIVADFVVRIDRQYVDISNYKADMVLTFSHQQDGLVLVEDDGGGDFNVGSRFRLPRTAPEEGYIIKKIERHMSYGSFGYDLTGRAKEGANYIFRVRSKIDSEGDLVEAVYGKVRGDIQLIPVGPRNDDLGGINMHYYLNPDHTRNLEYDPKQNLFKNLPRSEGNILAP